MILVSPISVEQKNDSCQLLKNEFIDKEQIYSLDIIREFIGNSNSLKNSIWSFDVDPVAKLKQSKIKGLGNRQKLVIRLLHKEFFQYDNPFFMQQNYLANKIGCDRTRITKVINFLVKKGIIIKLTYKSKNDTESNILIPSIQYLQVLTNQNGNRFKSNVNILKEEQKACAVLVCKYLILGQSAVLISKLLKNNKKKNTIYKDIIYKNSIKEIKSTPYSNEAKNSSFKESPSGSNLETRHMKHKLNIKSKIIKHKLQYKKTNTLRDKFKKQNTLDADPLKQQFKKAFESAKEKDFDNFDYRTEKPLNTYISFEYDIDMLMHFKYADRYGTEYAEKEKKLRRFLIELAEADIPLNYKLSNVFIKQYNAVKHPKFTKTKISDESKTYINTVIVITHYLHFRCDGNIKMLLTAIKRLNSDGTHSKSLKYLRKWSALDFLLDHKNNGYMDTFLCENDKDFSGTVYHKKAKYPQAQEKWRDIFINVYHNNDRGEEDYKRYRNGLVTFLDNLIDTVIQEQRAMLGFKLTVASKRNGETFPILQEYLGYLMDNYGRGLLVKDIIEGVNWNNFINHRMRGEYGYTNFWHKLDKSQLVN